MIQIFVIAGVVFYLGAWSVASLNTQMRRVYQVNFEAQTQVMDLSAIRNEINRTISLRQSISEATRDALVQAPTAFDCCTEAKVLVIESVDAVRADGMTAQNAYRLAEAWAQLLKLQEDRLQTEQANWLNFVNLRNWLVPVLAQILLLLSLGIAWFRLNLVLLQPFDAVMRQLTQLMRGGEASQLDLRAAPEEFKFLSHSVERLVLGHREAIKTRSDQSAAVSKHSDELELQFQKLVEIASQPAFVLDTSGEVRMWNKHMMELTGIARARANKVKFSDEFMRGESRAIFGEAFLIARGQNIPDAFRCELHVGNRNISDITMQLSPQVDSALGVNRILGILETDSAHIIGSTSKASVAESTKSERLYAELSNSLHFLGPVNENLTEIESSRRLKSLISALSWIEGRAFERSFQPIDLTELVEHYVSSIMMQLDESSIALTLETDGDRAVVMGEASALIQALQALAQNATEAMEAADGQGHKLAIKVWHEGNEVLVRMRDTGSGLTLDESFTPFAPFATTKSEQGHAGLGLTHARDLVEEMSGSLTIEPSSSLVDFGFGVVIRLPKADDIGDR